LDDLNADAGPDTRRRAVQAVSNIGTNAIPKLLEMMRSRDSSIKRIFSDWSQNQALIGIHFTSAAETRAKATRGFYVLGPAANSAVPTLAILLNDPNAFDFASAALAGIGPAGVAPLTQALTNGNREIRYQAANTLGQFGLVRLTSDATPAALAAISVEARLAAPALIGRLKDPDDLMRAKAAIALGLLGHEPEIVVPALIENLQDTNTSLRVLASAAKSLCRFQGAAQSAVPLLLKALEHPDKRVREAATNALQQIDSEAAAKAGVHGHLSKPR